MAPNMTEKVFWLFVFFLQFLCQDYSALMELALCPLLSQYNESSVKMPCESIGVQVFADFFCCCKSAFQTQLWPENLLDLKKEDIEVCLGPEMGVLGIDALPHPNPKVLYNPGVHIIQLLFSLVRLPWSNFKRLPHHFLHSYGKGWSPSSDRISYRQVFFFKMVLPRNCTALYTNLFSGVGAEYHETIACSLCLAFTAVHAPYARELLGKQVFFSLQK